MGETLKPRQIQKQLPPKWAFEDDEIVRTYEFESYLTGIEFVADVARIADEAFHHPRITIEFRSVTVAFTSHEAGGVTEEDLELAEQVEGL